MTFYKTAVRFCAVLISTLIISGCATQQTNTEVSPEQAQFYEGQTMLPFLAEQQAKTAEEAMLRADRALQAGSLDRALFNYIRALELDNQHITALIRIGDIHYQRGNLSTSYAAYQKALQIDASSGEALKGSGMILLHRKSYSMAKNSLTRAVETLLGQEGSEQALLQSYTGLGIINDLNGDYSSATLNYKEAEKLAPRSAMVKSNLGYSYYMQERWDLAEKTLLSSLQIDNSYAPAWKNLGLTYARQERYLEALSALEEVMETAQAYNDIGYICLISQRYEQAAVFFRKAIKEHPQYYPTAQQNLTRVKRLLASNPDGRSSL